MLKQPSELKIGEIFYCLEPLLLLIFHENDTKHFPKENAIFLVIGFSAERCYHQVLNLRDKKIYEMYYFLNKTLIII